MLTLRVSIREPTQAKTRLEFLTAVVSQSIEHRRAELD